MTDTKEAVKVRRPGAGAGLRLPRYLPNRQALRSLQVIVKCRPFNDQERRDRRAQAVEVDSRARQVSVQSVAEGNKAFTFDQVFGPDSQQEEVYGAACAPLVDAALQGFNATVFAYGQTGSGKTHTMEGRDEPAELRGIIPRAFDHIFQDIQQGGVDREFLVRVSHLELYNEGVRDLLSRDTRQQLELRESPDRGVHVRGLKEFVVKSAQEMRAVLEVGAKNRTVGATLMNQDSSRSHSIFTIIIESVEKPGSGSSSSSSAHGAAAIGTGRSSTSSQGSASPGKAGADGGGGIRVGKLNLVDLAGSERQAKTRATGDRLKEASKINLSLSALGNVISALTSEGGEGAHVPYRDSKLTRLLQDSLGGSAKTVMIANVGPADYNFEETLSTLRYASRAKFIKNRPKINEDPKDAMLREFQAEVARLKTQLAERKQARAASAGGSPEKQSTEAAAASAPARAGGAADACGGSSAADARAAALRRSMRAELQEQLRKAASMEALAKARQVIEQQARQRLEAELASKGATLEERQLAEAQLAARRAELQSCAAEVEREERERLALEQRIRAMESKVLRGGENLLEKVQVLETAAQQGAEALAAQQAARRAAEARIAQLEAAASEAVGRYSSVQEEVTGKRAKLQRLAAAVALAQRERASLAEQYQSERERLLDEIRRLGTQTKQKDAIIGAYIPPEYQELIMSRCHWEEGAQRWAVEHLEWAGNLVRARREASMSGSEVSLSGSGPSSARSAGGSTSFGDTDGTALGLPRGLDSDPGDGFGTLHGSSERLSDVYFSYAASCPPGPGGRPGGGALGSPLVGGRPRTAALVARQSLQRPVSGLGRAF